MSNLLAALSNSASALQVFQQALTVTQNNVSNVSTPGYVKQVQTLQALPFDAAGSMGGVAAGPVQSARDSFADQNVQSLITTLGTWTQQSSTLDPVQGNFDVSGQTGVPAALTQLYSSFSTWASAPNDLTARQGVLSAAQSVASAFQQTGAALTDAKASADENLKGLVDQVNQLTSQLRDNNAASQQAGGADPALDASTHATLEQLAQLVPITSFPAKDGSTTVLLNGQTPLVMGQQQYGLQAQFTGSGAQVLDSSGADITTGITQGEVGGLLAARNGILQQLSGNNAAPGQLDQLAKTVADRVNSILESGTSSDGPPPVAGVALFSYDGANPGNVSQTLAVNPSLTPDQLAANDPGPPVASNGIALRLANLSSPQSAADTIGGLSYAQFFGKMAGEVGSAVSTAQTNATKQQDLVTQAQDLRQQTSGVSLDEEAVKVLEFQRSYQAASKMVSVLDSMLQSVLDMMP
jgi:flagellar hook-associated protein 1 FlgK